MMAYMQGQIQVLWGLKFIQFWDPFWEKEYKIINTKLGMKVSVYLEWEKKSQQITEFKKLTNITNIRKSRKIT